MGNGRSRDGRPKPRKRPFMSLLQLHNGYSLCSLCLKRNSPPARVAQRAARKEAGSGRCEICRGLMVQLDSIASRIVAAAKGYQFKTFLIGAVLPTQIYDREDALRARLKIRGIENVKGQFTRELGMRLARLTARRVDYQRPELTISLSVDKENSVTISTRSRPLMFRGTYTKKIRGLAQKQPRCGSCEGKGCAVCGLTGLSAEENSVEAVISRGLVSRTGGQAPRFSWLGSEDRESLVLGKGRPFYVRVFDPKKRRLAQSLRVSSDGIFARLSAVPESEELAEAQPRFAVKTKIRVGVDRIISRSDLTGLQRALAGRQVALDSRGKMVTKRVYRAKATGLAGGEASEFVLVIDADGGLGIKQFVGGEQFASPSISELLGAKCYCVNFDILAVRFLSDKRQLTSA